jgi:predicted nucleic acid-binding protein
MSRCWIANASPLILLGKVGQADLLAKLCDELVVPDRVAREVSSKPEGERLVDDLARLPTFRSEGEIAVPLDVEVWDLGPGESQVLALALGRPEARAVLDDLEARRCAKAIGVPVIGTLGVVLRAKRRGILPEARPVVEKLRAAGLYASSDLIQQALALLGE